MWLQYAKEIPAIEETPESMSGRMLLEAKSPQTDDFESTIWKSRIDPKWTTEPAFIRLWIELISYRTC
jgi:hypothetical protein